jgi:acyl-coenzyme A synthetase/AMP-(fatty) acid ligase
MSLPDYMVPSRIIVVDDMPLNASGKMDSVVLRARLAK